ncbi:DNA internalization-related competence protein ComEC/Rec2 [Lysobacter sp. SG-8]|uniref:DNA internalization-related competence protein ComEC/Rec2 n=1 Tax=Marilutibacter penaei TaxID=2759900 RepID=A0A7W3U5A4_9GAMM|nr:DNA internalization-related competence protein ComEC/Rec2 [Lysobacter penaei]
MQPAAGTPPVIHAPAGACARRPAVALFGPGSAAALLTGVVAVLLSPAWPPAGWGIPVVVAGLSCLVGGWRRRRRAYLWMGWVLAGVGLAVVHAAGMLAAQLPPRLEGAEMQVTGRVVSLVDRADGRLMFDFRVDPEATQPGALRGALLRLAWHAREGTSPAAVAPGERWQLRVRVRAPRGVRNPGGFDAERHALAAGRVADGQVRSPADARRITTGSSIDAWRERMAARIEAGVPAPSSRFIRALALGDTRGVSDQDWYLLRANGLTHLIAISGFHVGLVAGFAALLCQGLWWLWPGLGRSIPRPLAAGLAAVAGAAVYAAVAGFALPTVRTVLMIAVVVLSRLARERSAQVDALSIAAIVVLLVDPLAVLGAGFWLSFAGVAWLMWCLPVATRRPVRAFLLAQGVVTVGLLPLSVALFGQASLAGPIANLVAVPWWSLVVVPLVLAGTALDGVWAGAGVWAWRLGAWCFDLTWPLFEHLGGSRLALAWLPDSSWVAVPMAVLGAFWMLLPRGLPGKPLAALLWLPLLWPAKDLPAHGELEMQVLDVGQGLAIVVRTAGHVLLYDAGPLGRSGHDAGERIVVPALHGLGIRRLDRIMLSHADADHAGGLAATRSAFDTDTLVAPHQSGIEGATACVAGDAWAWDGVWFEVLHPTPFFPYLGNESSCVLRISSPHGRVLLTGDIGTIIEQRLLRMSPQRLGAEVVVVPHHGSNGSSSPSFIEAVGARHAIVSTAHGNHFRHPRPEIVARWSQAGAAWHDTAVTGAVRVGLSREGVDVESRRRAQRRGWDAEARRRAASVPP